MSNSYLQNIADSTIVTQVRKPFIGIKTYWQITIELAWKAFERQRSACTKACPGVLHCAGFKFQGFQSNSNGWSSAGNTALVIPHKMLMKARARYRLARFRHCDLSNRYDCRPVEVGHSANSLVGSSRPPPLLLDELVFSLGTMIREAT